MFCGWVGGWVPPPPALVPSGAAHLAATAAGQGSLTDLPAPGVPACLFRPTLQSERALASEREGRQRAESDRAVALISLEAKEKLAGESRLVRRRQRCTSSGAAVAVVAAACGGKAHSALAAPLRKYIAGIDWRSPKCPSVCYVCGCASMQEAERRVQETLALQQALAELAAGGTALVSCCAAAAAGPSAWTCWVDQGEAHLCDTPSHSAMLSGPCLPACLG